MSVSMGGETIHGGFIVRVNGEPTKLIEPLEIAC